MFLAALITTVVIAVGELCYIIDLTRTVKFLRHNLERLGDDRVAAELAEADMRRTLTQKEEMFWQHLQKAHDRGELEGLRATMMLDTALRYAHSTSAKEAVEAEAMSKEYAIRLREYEDALEQERHEQPKAKSKVVMGQLESGASKEVDLSDPAWERIV